MVLTNFRPPTSRGFAGVVHEREQVHNIAGECIDFVVRNHERGFAGRYTGKTLSRRFAGDLNPFRQEVQDHM